MELRHLRYFIAVAEALHFGEAASRLRIAQPSLSQQIRQLEAELQTTLLRRTKRRVELTPAGLLFLEEARDILARTNEAALIARRAGRGDGRRLRVGVGFCMDQMAVVRALSVFKAQHPSIRVELQTMAVPSQISALKNERLDVGFVRPSVLEASLGSEVVVNEPLVVALPRSHRLASRQAVSLSALADESFALTSREAAPVFHDFVLNICREAGFVPNAPHEADHLHLLLGFVTAGCGVALVPACAKRMKPPHVVFAPLRASKADLETAVAWRREGASAPVADLVSIARRVLTHAQRRLALSFDGSRLSA
jgi:DNA-binding transcriptional LysR family regulator